MISWDKKIIYSTYTFGACHNVIPVIPCEDFYSDTFNYRNDAVDYLRLPAHNM